MALFGGEVCARLAAIFEGLSKMPDGMFLRNLIGTGFLGGIGFTMAIFVTFLALPQDLAMRVNKGSILS